MLDRRDSTRALRVTRNARNRINGVALLRSLRDEEASLAFLDPQYRGILDQLAFGNEGARQAARAALPQMSDDDVAFFVEQLARVLKPSGHLMLWLDKFSIGSGHHLRYFARTPRLALVDLIHWNKMRFGMGRRARCCSEYLLVVQKRPTLAKNVWTDNAIRDSWAESTDTSAHPHAKPIALIERLIRATTKAGDLVVDPAAGGYGVLEACRITGRNFVGCDIATKEDEHAKGL
jgi:site-specific DNA-methyltransferase (adenine-specific)